jgi:hypothetical protein
MSTDESRKDENKNSISLTDMRLRKMILDSGTPLLISKEMAWTAELPEQKVESHVNTNKQCKSYIQSGNLL